jgi:hypothetical protein
MFLKGESQIIQLIILPQLIYKFRVIPIKTLTGFLLVVGEVGASGTEK